MVLASYVLLVKVCHDLVKNEPTMAEENLGQNVLLNLREVHDCEIFFLKLEKEKG